MKKYVFFSGAIALSITFQAVGAEKNYPQQPNGNMAQQQQLGPGTDCSKLTVAEQSFANQLTDMNNRSLFCSQFNVQQRQQAMNLQNQPDAMGNTMSADQAVQQVMQMGAPSSAQPRRSGRACPVK